MDGPFLSDTFMKRFVYYGAVVIAPFLFGCRSDRNGVLVASEREVVPDVVTDKNSPDDAALAVIQKMNWVSDTANVWKRIAASPDFSIKRRRECICVLFHNNARSGMSLGEITEKIGNASWLSKCDIRELVTLAGAVPVDLTTKDRIFILSVLPTEQTTDSAVFFRISGYMTSRELLRVLEHDPTVPDWVGRTEVAEVGIVCGMTWIYESGKIIQFLTSQSQ